MADSRKWIKEASEEGVAANEDLREEGVRPLIKHREFRLIDHAHNARIDGPRYRQRALCETVFSAIKRTLAAQLVDYRSKREACLKWLLTFGKDPDQAEGYARTTVGARASRMDRFYRWGGTIPR